MLYNPPMAGLHRTTLVILAFLVATFVALYPYLGGMGMCDSGECPQIAHSASGGVSETCLVAVAAAATPVVRAIAAFRRRVVTSESRPVQVYSSPDPPPPRIS
jgi:hypothetical protein